MKVFGAMIDIAINFAYIYIYIYIYVLQACIHMLTVLHGQSLVKFGISSDQWIKSLMAMVANVHIACLYSLQCDLYL